MTTTPVEDDWNVLRTLRLKALQDAPQAFISSIEQEIAFDEPAWRKLTATSIWFVARTSNEAIGVAAGTTAEAADQASANGSSGPNAT